MALAYALCFGATLWVAYHGHLPTWFQRIPNYDKPAHLILYAIATYLGHRCLNHRHVRLSRWLNGRGSRYQLPLFPLLFTLFTIVEELSQGASPHRTLDALDLVCSLAGVGLGYGLAQRSPQKPTRKGQ
ncbi:MAG: hypothetical protein HC771_09730 [Synechococcales cyanobacterium CRU_2_2]|nr:hypothetical protein [Synechococcales cyanobacterium CRU_2_2]